MKWFETRGHADPADPHRLRPGRGVAVRDLGGIAALFAPGIDARTALQLEIQRSARRDARDRTRTPS